MASKSTQLFATDNDLTILVDKVSSLRPLQFAAMGQFASGTPVLWDRFSEAVTAPQVLAFDKGLAIAARSVPQHAGSTKFAIEQLSNAKTVVIQRGGTVEGSRLLASQIGTSSNDPASEAIYALFAKEIRRGFEKVKSYYLGSEALRLLDEGVRLSPNAKSPEAYDLKR